MPKAVGVSFESILFMQSIIYINKYSARGPEQTLMPTEVMELKGNQFEVTQNLTRSKS